MTWAATNTSSKVVITSGTLRQKRRTAAMPAHAAPPATATASAAARAPTPDERVATNAAHAAPMAS